MLVKMRTPSLSFLNGFSAVTSDQAPVIQPWLLDQLEIATEFQAACFQRPLLTPLKTKDCLSHIKAYQKG